MSIADDISALIAGASARAGIVWAIHANEGAERWSAIRAFYVKAWEELKSIPAHEWGLDPYEAMLDRHMTPIELALWHDLRAERIVMYPQFPVGRYFVDFGNPQARVAIECDGAAFHRDIQRDKQRQAEIEAKGWTVYRFTGKECLQDFREEEDEFGNCVVVASETRKRLRDMAFKHGLSTLHTERSK